jgi:hypothetical protein
MKGPRKEIAERKAGGHHLRRNRSKQGIAVQLLKACEIGAQIDPRVAARSGHANIGAVGGGDTGGVSAADKLKHGRVQMALGDGKTSAGDCGGQAILLHQSTH